jgi:hypothetical protein
LNEKEAAQVDDWTPQAHRLHHPLGVSLPESTENSPFSSQENAINQNSRNLCEGLRINAINSGQSEKGH